jgi:hypothetical protein
MKVRFISVGDEFSQPLFFTSQSLHPRVVFLIFSVCALWVKRPIIIQIFGQMTFLSTGVLVRQRIQSNGQLAFDRMALRSNDV